MPTPGPGSAPPDGAPVRGSAAPPTGAAGGPEVVAPLPVSPVPGATAMPPEVADDVVVDPGCPCDATPPPAVVVVETVEVVEPERTTGVAEGREAALDVVAAALVVDGTGVVVADVVVVTVVVVAVAAVVAVVVEVVD